MTWQEPLALAIVALTFVAFLWQPARRWFGLRQSRSVCSCIAATHKPPPYTILFTARRGQNPKIVFRRVDERKDSLA